MSDPHGDDDALVNAAYELARAILPCATVQCRWCGFEISGEDYDIPACATHDMKAVITGSLAHAIESHWPELVNARNVWENATL